VGDEGQMGYMCVCGGHQICTDFSLIQHTVLIWVHNLPRPHPIQGESGALRCGARCGVASNGSHTIFSPTSAPARPTACLTAPHALHTHFGLWKHCPEFNLYLDSGWAVCREEQTTCVDTVEM
jgi:hypothetical protein